MMIPARPIYLDHNATTPVDPDVAAAMEIYLRDRFGNPSSLSHEQGRAARRGVDEAREEVAALIGADASEIVFTSGATESNNTAVKGSGWALRDERRRIVTSAIEHRSVLESCRWMEGEGYPLTVLPVDREGRIDPGALASRLASDVALVSVMHANSEVGAIQPVEAVGALCRAQDVRFHTDATQTAGKIPVDVERIGCDLLSLSAHKLYGPKGVGALYVRRRRRLVPLLSGGGQEKDRRSGTPNVPGIVGFGVASRLARERMAADAGRARILAARLRDKVLASVPGVTVNGPLEDRLPGNLNLSFEDLDAQALIEALPGVCVSSGSACAAGSTEPSYVLLAMGLSPEGAYGSVRFGIGRGTTEEEIDRACALIAQAAERLRGLSTRMP